MSGIGTALRRIGCVAFLAWALAGCAEQAATGADNPAWGAPLRLKVGGQVIDVTRSADGGGSATAPSTSRLSEAQEQQQLVIDAWNAVDKEFYDKDAVDYQKMAHAAIRGMLESLGDEETALSDAPTTKLANDDLRGRFEGIGVTVQAKGKRLVVVSPIEGSPGAKAGIQAGDVITRIDDRDATTLSLQDAVSLIRGPRGTKVRVAVERQGENRPLTLEITRDEINVVSVRSQMIADIGYLKINQFTQPTGDAVQEQLAELMRHKPNTIILDLRNNPGGLLTSALEVASQFISDGTVMYVQDRDNGLTEVAARPGGAATQVPVLVLINKGSASAAEIVAGALQDLRRGVLVGEPTFGKDTVQNVQPLNDGSTLNITVARWYTPKMRAIAGKGLTPDVAAPLTEDDINAGRDPQLDRALAIARGDR